MSNFFVALASAIKEGDTSLIKSFLENGSSAAFSAFILMDVKAAWQPILDTDTDNAVNASLPGGAGAAKAAYYQSQFQVDSQSDDSQSSVWENLVQTDQTEVDNISDARKGNFQLAQGMAQTSAQCSALLGNFTA